MADLNNFTDDERLIFRLTLETEHLAHMLHEVTGMSFENIAYTLSINIGIHNARMNDQEATELIQAKRTDDQETYHAVIQSIKANNN